VGKPILPRRNRSGVRWTGLVAVTGHDEGGDMQRIILIAVASILGGTLLASAAQGRIDPGARTLSGPYIGSYSATLTVAQAAAKGDRRLAGKFRLVLRRNGTYTASNSFDPPASGKLAALSGHRLRFYADTGCKYGGFERPQGGTYLWTLSGTRLKLTLVSEGACTGRRDTLTFPVWKRS
jgi:hypothetical protein